MQQLPPFDLLNGVATESELKDLCVQFSQSMTFEYYLFAICNVTSLSAPEIVTITNYPDAWLKQYFEQKYQRSDSVVRYCFERLSPIRWSDLSLHPEYSSPEGDQIFTMAAEVGLKHGISIPLRAHSGEICILSLASSSGDDIDARFNAVVSPAQSLVTELFLNLKRVRQPKQDETENLTEREIECLFWACEGKTTWEVSQILGITERTVIFHLTSATKKLGAVNRQHAVAKALTSGIIKPRL